jgi:hypothetical protein
MSIARYGAGFCAAGKAIAFLIAIRIPKRPYMDFVGGGTPPQFTVCYQ